MTASNKAQRKRRTQTGEPEINFCLHIAMRKAKCHFKTAESSIFRSVMVDILELSSFRDMTNI